MSAAPIEVERPPRTCKDLFKIVWTVIGLLTLFGGLIALMYLDCIKGPSDCRSRCEREGRQHCVQECQRP